MSIRTFSEAKDVALIGLMALNVGAILWSIQTNMRLDKEIGITTNIVETNTKKIEQIEVKNDSKNSEQDYRLTRLEMILPTPTREKKNPSASDDEDK